MKNDHEKYFCSLAVIIIVALISAPATLAEGKLRIVQRAGLSGLHSEWMPIPPLANVFDEIPWDDDQDEIDDEPDLPPGQDDPVNVFRDRRKQVRIALPRPMPRRENKREALFMRGHARGVVVWNGKSDDHGEELLILSSEEISATGEDEAVIGIIPLPGKPVAVGRIDGKVFEILQNEIVAKISETQEATGNVVAPDPRHRFKVASYTVFVLKISDPDRFSDEIADRIEPLYSEKVRIEMTPSETEIIRKYWDRGFRYFAFDLSLLGKKPLVKMPIVFRFKSKFAYYPMAVDAIGGNGHGLLDLIVMTPKTINISDRENKKNVTSAVVRGNTSVEFSVDEIERRLPILAGFFKEHSLKTMRARNFLIETENIGGFETDFIATSAVPSQNEEKEQDRPTKTEGPEKFETPSNGRTNE